MVLIEKQLMQREFNLQFSPPIILYLWIAICSVHVHYLNLKSIVKMWNIAL